MKYIIDTHILIWLAVSPEKVPKRIMEIIEEPTNTICISTISLWEIAIKLAIKKLELKNLDIEDLVEICHEQDIKIMQLPISAVKQYKSLPIKPNHKDPFDRILISLCICEDYVFLSSDTKVGQYKENGLIFVN